MHTQRYKKFETNSTLMLNAPKFIIYSTHFMRQIALTERSSMQFVLKRQNFVLHIQIFWRI